MSIRSNHFPETLDQPAAPPQRVPPRSPRPVPIPPRLDTLSAADALAYQGGGITWHVEYWLQNLRRGRFLGGPYRTRQAALEYAMFLLEHTEREHEVKRVTVVAMKAGSARPRREGGAA